MTFKYILASSLDILKMVIYHRHMYTYILTMGMYRFLLELCLKSFALNGYNHTYV